MPLPDLPKPESNVEVGIQVVPKLIMQHIQHCTHNRPDIPHVYHVTDIIYCIRKEYFKRKHPDLKEYTQKGMFNIFRGQQSDKEFSPLFEHNQESFVMQRDGICITGTFDFINKENGEQVLYDLKIPATIFFKKKDGAGKFYAWQVQAYLAMIHLNHKYFDVNKAKVLMIAEDFVTDTVQANDEAIIEWLWGRAFLLDEALNRESPKTLPSPNLDDPEEKWQCNPDYCSYHDLCEKSKMECDKVE